MFSGLAVSQDVPARRWTALASFTLQAAVVAAALIYPLLNPDSLPRVFHPLFLPLSQGAPAEPAQQPVRGGGYATQHPILVNLHPLTFGPSHPHSLGDSTATAPDINALIGSGDPRGMLHSLTDNLAQPVPHPTVTPRNIRISAMMEGNLIHKVEPQYPPIAKQIGLQGAVILKAFISREGVIERVHTESGHPILARAALDAVRQWRYKPYYLNGEPIEVETEITVNFMLQR